jgi:copper oxidase (laccase) domain-containing protein
METKSIFEGRASVLHTGTEFGVVHPKDPAFSSKIDKLRIMAGQKLIVAPRLAFNTKVTPLRSLDDLVVGEGMKGGEMMQIDGFYRTPEASDGVIIDLNGETAISAAITIMNADCGTIEILAPNGEMAVMHGGFDNVDNRDGSSIVTNAIGYFVSQGFHPSELYFRVGEAAQACCYGLNNPNYATQNAARAERLKQAYGIDVVRPVKNLPRSANEGIGFDVPLIAARQADQEGIQEIEVESVCTSCHRLVDSAMGQLDTFGTWYSNLRESGATVKERGYGSRNSVSVYPTTS